MDSRVRTALEAARRGDHATAWAILQPLASSGCADAQVEVAHMLLLGDGVERDTNEARMWLQRAVDNGSLRGQFELGHSLFSSNPEAARVTLLESHTSCLQAASSGNAEAWFLLGLHHELGIAVNVDLEAAASCYVRAFELGEPDAAGHAAAAFSILRRGTSKFNDAARHWYHLAKSLGVLHTNDEELERLYPNPAD